MTKIKLFKSPLIEELERKVNSFLGSEIGNKVKDEATQRTYCRTLKDIQYVKDISDSAVMIIYEEVSY